jgi:hypothetical protein
MISNKTMYQEKGTIGAVTATSPLAEKDETSDSHRNALICVLIVTACVLLTNPVANTPFSDEFSYDKTALEFARTGHILYNGWATAMLGWLIPWGALCIKAFGFSFTVMRLSMLPIDAVTVYLFHQILRRFGINSGNAIFGTLAFALSPIFMPSAASFMTDVPGMFVIFACLYMCQEAVRTTSDRAAAIWLTFATVFNVAGGTVRQIAWLGALIMVPSTVWLLRKRHGMKATGAALWVFSLINVLIFLHWFNSQPYSVPEHIIWAQVYWMTFPHLAAQYVKTFLCLLLVIFPVTAAWLPSARKLHRKAWLRIALVMGLFVSLEILAYALGRIDTWIMPWLNFLMPEQSSLAPGMFGTPVAMALWIRLVISFVVIATALIVLEQEIVRKQSEQIPPDNHETSWNGIAWILGPFSISYLLLLAPRGAFDQIQDRYLVGLVPTAIVVMLKLYQEQVGAKLPVVSMAMLAVFGVYSVAGTHDFFAESRAQVRAIQMVEDSGVPRKSIQAGFPSDGWVQIENGGHINEARIKVPAGAYNPNPPELKILPDGCANGFTRFAPIITPKYFTLFPWFKNPLDPPPSWCFVHAGYPPIDYTTWLPPFRATLYIEKLANRSN